MPRSLASSRSSQSDKTKSSDSGNSTDLVTNDEASVSALSLSGIQHLDRQGKVITDPDRSNPTRPRLERPLDTIRGFEAAIAARRGGHVA